MKRQLRLSLIAFFGTQLLALSAHADTAVTAAPGTVSTPVTVPPATPGALPPSDLGASLTPVQKQAAYQQYLALRDQLIEERRQAILKASQLPDGSARWKVFADLQASQADRQAQLRQLHAQSITVERQTQAAQATLEGKPVTVAKKLQ